MAFGCNLLAVSIHLKSMAIIYFLVFVASVLYLVLGKKSIQKYSFPLEELYFGVVITVLFLVLFLKIFSRDLLLIYQNSDPAVHYKMALDIRHSFYRTRCFSILEFGCFTL